MLCKVFSTSVQFTNNHHHLMDVGSNWTYKMFLGRKDRTMRNLCLLCFYAFIFMQMNQFQKDFKEEEIKSTKHQQNTLFYTN